MTSAVPRSAVDAFYRAYDARDVARIEALLDDNVSWQIVGPRGIMQICGQWHGKAAVVDWFARIVPQFVKFIRLDRDCLLVDGDQSALFGRIFCQHIASSRTICHQVAQFVRYRNGKVVSFSVLNDSLDAAEQYIGHHITGADEAGSNKSNLITV